MYYDLAKGERFVDERSDIIRVDEYTLKVDSIHTSQNKKHFLIQKVSVINCKNPVDLEKLAVKHKVQLWGGEKELMNSVLRNFGPKKYLKSRQEQLIQDIKEIPEYFLNNLPKKVQERLNTNQQYFNSLNNKRA